MTKKGYLARDTGLWITILLGIGITLLLITLFVSYGDYCNTSRCFFQKANACQPAKYLQRISSLTIEFESGQDCVLRKKVVQVKQTEPDAVKVAFYGAQMECTYTQGYFNYDHLTKITAELDNCNGKLKEAIQKMY